MEAPRLTAVVVFPTPPFWLATARTVPMPCFTVRGGPVGRPMPSWFGGEWRGPALRALPAARSVAPAALGRPRRRTAGNKWWLEGGFHTLRRIYRRFVWDHPHCPSFGKRPCVGNPAGRAQPAPAQPPEGRFAAIPARLGNRAGVVATFRYTCRWRSRALGKGETRRTSESAIPTSSAAAPPRPSSSDERAPFHATSTPPSRSSGAAYS